MHSSRWFITTTCAVLLVAGAAIGFKLLHPSRPSPLALSPKPIVPAYYETMRQVFVSLPSRGDLVFLGDSRVGHGLWNERFPRREVANRGIDGDTCAGVLARVEEDVPIETRTVIVEVGINDLSASARPEEVAANMDCIIRALKARRCREIILCSIAPVTIEREVALHVNERVGKANQLILRHLDSTVRWADLSPLTSAGALVAENSWDGIHFTSRAYTRWCEVLHVPQ